LKSKLSVIHSELIKNALRHQAGQSEVLLFLQSVNIAKMIPTAAYGQKPVTYQLRILASGEDKVNQAKVF